MSQLIHAHILDSIAILGLAVGLVVVGWLWQRPTHRATQAGALQARQLGPYALAEKIGEGAMGEVYRARHAMLRRWCAIKVLSRDVSECAQRRFEKEVQLTAQLSHPNTVSIYDFGRAADGSFYYAMELLDGVTLQQLVEEQGPQTPSRVIHILQQLCGSLREAHGAGLIHRDIKPANIVLCRQGGTADVAKLVDFGLVESVDELRTSDSMNFVVGTPLYMSPESIAAPHTVNARSDLYALGAVAYFLLTGKPVFAATNVVDVCSQHLHAAPAPLGRAVPADLARIVLDCLAKNPLARPASAAELGKRLERCVDAGTWSEADAEESSRAPLSGPISSRLDTVISAVEELRACA